MRFVEDAETRLVRYLILRTIIRVDCGETKPKAAELKLEFQRIGYAAKSRYKERTKRGKREAERETPTVCERERKRE